MIKILTYKDFINEGLTDKMKPKSEDEVLKSLEKLSDSDKIIAIIKHQLNFDLLPDNLTVREFLDLRGTKITKLPKSLRVGAKIWKDF